MSKETCKGSKDKSVVGKSKNMIKSLFEGGVSGIKSMLKGRKK